MTLYANARRYVTNSKATSQKSRTKRCGKAEFRLCAWSTWIQQNLKAEGLPHTLALCISKFCPPCHPIFALSWVFCHCFFFILNLFSLEFWALIRCPQIFVSSLIMNLMEHGIVIGNFELLLKTLAHWTNISFLKTSREIWNNFSLGFFPT